MTVFLTTLGLIGAAEMGDKTQLLTLALAARLPLGAVLGGVVVATLLTGDEPPARVVGVRTRDDSRRWSGGGGWPSARTATSRTAAQDRRRRAVSPLWRPAPRRAHRIGHGDTAHLNLGQATA